jgi:hypothetical protein
MSPATHEEQMEKDTIARHIKALSKSDFDSVVTLLFHEVFRLKATNVDGPADGGSDMRCYVTSKELKIWASTAIQVTVTGKSWKQKAIDDAKKAVRDLGATKFYFLTSVGHSSSDLRKLENEIQDEIGIPATCLGANELAGLIHDDGLFREFAIAIDLQLDVQITSRPDRQEMLLHAIAGLSDEKRNFRESVYDDALLVTLFEANSHLSRAQLIANATKLLGLTIEFSQSLTQRVDSLLARGRIVPADDKLTLSPSDKFDLQSSSGMYLSELRSLASAQQFIVEEKGGGNWTNQQAEETAVLLSRIFVLNHLKVAEHASLPLTRLGLSRGMGDPKAELLKIIQKTGLDLKTSEETIREFVSMGNTRPLIQKLTRAVTYLATEGRSIAQACRALGASKWSDVFVTLDASVAIPFLCSSLFAPTEGRFSMGANECINTIKKLNARLVMPYFYINEVAAHLLLALNTPSGEQYSIAAEYSTNGFVSHYYQLRNNRKKCPPTLPEFLKVFSESSIRGNGDRRDKAKSIMPDIQMRLQEYGISFESIESFPSGTVGYLAHRKPTEESFEHFLHQSRRNRRQNLIRHDVNVLAYSKKAVSELGQARMCLTWDRTMIEVARELKDCGWVVTPNDASDLVQTSVDFSEVKLTSLAHALAKTTASAEQIGASILDRVSHLSGSPFQGWEFRNEFDEFYSKTMARIAQHPESTQWVDDEVEQFMSGYSNSTTEDEADTPE